MSWPWIALTAAVAALVISYGVFMERRPEEVSTAPRLLEPGIHMKDAIMTDTDVDGRARLRMAARQIVQNAADKSWTLHEVKVDYLAIPDKSWVLTAQRGEVPADLDSGVFSGDVTLRQIDARMPGTLRTESLTVNARTSVASTTDPVTIELQGHRIAAQGMTADLKTERIRLEANVHGRFENP